MTLLPAFPVLALHLDLDLVMDLAAILLDQTGTTFMGVDE